MIGQGYEYLKNKLKNLSKTALKHFAFNPFLKLLYSRNKLNHVTEWHKNKIFSEVLLRLTLLKP